MSELAALLRSMEDLRWRSGALEAERNRLANLFHRSGDAYLITDRWGTIRVANAAAAARLGRAGRHLAGKPLACFVPLAERREFRSRLAALEAQASWTCSVFSFAVRRSPGGLNWVVR